MKIILEIILVIIGLSIGCMFLPALIGILIGVFNFDSGNTFGGIIAITIGLAVQVLLFVYIFGSGGGGGGFSDGKDEDCPYCGSGDTDGNHCYTCEDDF